MQLRSIAFQSSSPHDDRPFSQKYGQRHMESEIGVRFLRLIEYLERYVEAPPQWICTSHYNLLFFPQDVQKYAELINHPRWTLAVHARQTGFKITTHLHSFGTSEAMRVEHPETIDEAASIISDVLNKRDLQI